MCLVKKKPKKNHHFLQLLCTCAFLQKLTACPYWASSKDSLPRSSMMRARRGLSEKACNQHGVETLILKEDHINFYINSCMTHLLMCSLVTSIFLYACESWTLTAELQRKLQTMEMGSYCKILCISYKDHVTYEEVLAKIQQAIRPHKDLTMVKRCKLKWYGHVSCLSGLA